MTSRGSTFRSPLRIVAPPSSPMWRIVSVSSWAATQDFSLLLKSSWPMVATRVFEPAGNGLLVCGYLRA